MKPDPLVDWCMVHHVNIGHLLEAARRENKEIATRLIDRRFSFWLRRVDRQLAVRTDETGILYRRGKAAEAEAERREREGRRNTLSVRKSVYRGKAGFLICGRNFHGQALSIFTHTQESAYRIRNKARMGMEITTEDFYLCQAEATQE